MNECMIISYKESHHHAIFTPPLPQRPSQSDLLTTAWQCYLETQLRLIADQFIHAIATF